MAAMSAQNRARAAPDGSGLSADSGPAGPTVAAAARASLGTRSRMILWPSCVTASSDER